MYLGYNDILLTFFNFLYITIKRSEMLSLKVRINPDNHQKICLETLANEYRLLYNHLHEGAKEGLGFKELNERYKS